MSRIDQAHNEYYACYLVGILLLIQRYRHDDGYNSQT